MAKRKKITPYLIPTDPAKLARKWQSLSGEHYSSFKQVREWCDTRMTEINEKERAEPGSTRVNEVRSIVMCLVAAVAGEREALSMDYLDSSRAVARTKQLGFFVQRDDGAIEVASEYLGD